ncbi:MAG TPA: SpoIIE family protein phosphatase [Terriglobales bacterium]|nr:SpoIIE family protein phosphatase [Terriglobales bacterium]
MVSFSSHVTFVGLAVAPVSQSVAELRWQLTGVAIGVVVLSIGLVGLTLFIFIRRKTDDRSLVFFSLFSLLYGIRLICGQSIVKFLLPGSPSIWKHFDLVLECFIVIPLTLFLIETVQPHWRVLLRWVVDIQVAFGTARLFAGLYGFSEGAMRIANDVIVVAYCVLLASYPFSLRSGQRLPREFKVVYAGFVVFGLFVVHSNLIDLGLVRARGLEPVGFLVFVCSLGYLAAFRAFSNEERLLSIQKELEIARQIQSSILPRRIPQIAGMEIAARYLPMTAVAGDFYNFIVVDEKRVGILVADITGHGVPAALIASMLKVAFTAQSARAADPAQVLKGINHSLCGKFETHFVTAAYLFVDAEKQIFRYAAAGHPPLLFGSAGPNRRGAFCEIESNGLLLGISEDATYPALERPLHPGDRCILYTDGVLEAKNAAQQEFGTAGCLKFLGSQSNLAAAPLLTAFVDALTQWSGTTDGGGHEDDITLVVVDFERQSV